MDIVKPSSCAIQLKYVIYECTFTFHSTFILKSKTGEMSFNNRFYLTQHIQNVITSTGDQHKKC